MPHPPSQGAKDQDGGTGCPDVPLQAGSELTWFTTPPHPQCQEIFPKTSLPWGHMEVPWREGHTVHFILRTPQACPESVRRAVLPSSLFSAQLCTVRGAAELACSVSVLFHRLGWPPWPLWNSAASQVISYPKYLCLGLCVYGLVKALSFLTGLSPRRAGPMRCCHHSGCGT